MKNKTYHDDDDDEKNIQISIVRRKRKVVEIVLKDIYFFHISFNYNAAAVVVFIYCHFIPVKQSENNLINKISTITLYFCCGKLFEIDDIYIDIRLLII